MNTKSAPKSIGLFITGVANVESHACYISYLCARSDISERSANVNNGFAGDSLINNLVLFFIIASSTLLIFVKSTNDYSIL